MQDLMFVAITIIFFVVSVGYVHFYLVYALLRPEKF